jgi:hypothetical protein
MNKVILFHRIMKLILAVANIVNRHVAIIKLNNEFTTLLMAAVWEFHFLKTSCNIIRSIAMCS